MSTSGFAFILADGTIEYLGFAEPYRAEIETYAQKQIYKPGESYGIIWYTFKKSILIGFTELGRNGGFSIDRDPERETLEPLPFDGPGQDHEYPSAD